MARALGERRGRERLLPFGALFGDMGVESMGARRRRERSNAFKASRADTISVAMLLWRSLVKKASSYVHAFGKLKLSMTWFLHSVDIGQHPSSHELGKREPRSTASPMPAGGFML